MAQDKEQTLLGEISTSCISGTKIPEHIPEYPGYTFSYFHEFGIAAYEAPVEIALDEWFTLKAVVQDAAARFYLNGSDAPVLEVPCMKHGKGAKGALGIYVDIGTEAFVSDLKVYLQD